MAWATGCTQPTAPAGSRAAALDNAALDCQRTHVGLLDYTASAEEGPVAWPLESPHYCTATYIGAGYVLTAGHCHANSSDGMPHGIVLSGWRYPLDGAFGIVRHPQYGQSTAYDIAIARIAPLAAQPESRDPSIHPATIGMREPSYNETVVYAGHSEAVAGSRDFARRAGPTIVASPGPNILDYLGATAGGTGVMGIGGDSGGPTFAVDGGVEFIVGIHHDALTDCDAVSVRGWVDTACGGCLAAWTPPPPSFVAEDRVSAFCSGKWGDADQDGVPDWKDNCPTVPNADQRNCGGWYDDIQLHAAATRGDANQVGDACDPYPCIDLRGLIPVNASGGDHHYLYGGSRDESRLNDLWRLPLSTRRWTRLASGPEQLGETPPERASLAISRVDGTIRLLAGDHPLGQPQPAWSFDGTTWQSYQTLIGGQP